MSSSEEEEVWQLAMAIAAPSGLISAAVTAAFKYPAKRCGGSVYDPDARSAIERYLRDDYCNVFGGRVGDASDWEVLLLSLLIGGLVLGVAFVLVMWLRS